MVTITEMEIRHVPPIVIVLANLMHTFHAVKTLATFLWGHHHPLLDGTTSFTPVPSASVPSSSTSLPRPTPTQQSGEDVACLDSQNPLLSLGWNLGLILLFCVPHSTFKAHRTKNNLNHSNWNKYARTVYVAVTNCTILVVCHGWRTLTPCIIWQFRMPTIYHEQIIGSLHLMAWYLIFASSTMMDISGILGIKQVYYAHFNLGDPNYSPELKRFLNHRQHGSFVGLLLILWLQDRMTLDRLLLATVLSGWMYWAWRPDHQDFHYQKNRWKLKRMHWQTVAPTS